MKEAKIIEEEKLLGQERFMIRFEKEFKSMREEMKFKSTLEDLDKIFFIRDCMLKTGVLSKDLSRMICSRICETFDGWARYYHGLIIPNPGSLVAMTESSLFNEEDKKEIMKVMNKMLALVSENSVIGLTKDKKREAKFIDESVKVWNEIVGPKTTEIMKKVNNAWVEKSN